MSTQYHVRLPVPHPRPTASAGRPARSTPAATWSDATPTGSQRVDGNVGGFTSSETIKRCPEAGTGLAAVPVTGELAAGTLAALPWEGPDLRIRSYLGWDTTQWAASAMQAVRHAARSVLTREDEHLTGPARTASKHSSLGR